MQEETERRGREKRGREEPALVVVVRRRCRWWCAPSMSLVSRETREKLEHGEKKITFNAVVVEFGSGWGDEKRVNDFPFSTLLCHASVPCSELF